MSEDAQSEYRGEAADRPQDPLVDRLRPDPSQPPEPTRILEGLLGDSDRPGTRRLYFTVELDYYAEFRSEDVLSIADIAPDQPPFLGEPATRVTLRRDATVDFTHTHRARPLDEFDLDVRLAAGGAGALAPSTFGCGDTEFFGCTQFCTLEAACGGPTGNCPIPTAGGCETFQITICRGLTCACETDERTCITCRTCPTCRTCNQATCQTCRTLCGQATCQTCHTRCGQGTCRTCDTMCGTCSPARTCRPPCSPP